mgnify:CR=1 FL=1
MAELALVLLLGLVGPLLALPKRFGVPVALGELLIGVVFGASGLKVIDATSPNLQLLTQIGFALVMMIAASHIDLSRFNDSRFLGKALLGVIVTAALGLGVGLAIAQVTGLSNHWALFTVLLSSSSAAVVLPAFSGIKPTLSLSLFLTQIALADLLSIIALPLAISPGRIVDVTLGAILVAGASVVIWALLRWLDRTGRWKRMRVISAERGFGIELRVSLILLLVLIWLAQSFAVTILISGFGLGLAIAANGVPHRLAKQLFAVSEGLFSPVFFVLLGASIDVSALWSSQQLILLAVVLGFGAILVHLASMVLGMRFSYALASSAQLGVPAAAINIGLAVHAITSGEAAAIMAGAVITLVTTAISAAMQSGPTPKSRPAAKARR